MGKVLGDILCDCRPILHKYANEDVSLGSWFIGLEVEHIDDRNMCCGTPPGIVFRHISLENDFYSNPIKCFNFRF